MLDPVPWFIGGGAQHSPEVARLLAFAASRGAEGLIGSGDLKVRALDVPGASVRVSPGAALILNRATGGTQQTYVARNVADEVVNIAATGAGAGRSDLIVLRVEDPYMPGEPWADPADPTVGPYVRVVAITVPAGTTTVPSGTSGIALARIDIPSATSSITSAMIVDLRKIAAPRTKRVMVPAYPTTDNDLTGTQASPQVWPSVATANVDVPDWATHANMRADVAGVLGIGTNGGGFSVRLGGSNGVGVQNSRWASTNGARLNLVTGGTVTVPSSMRGTRQSVQATGFRDNASAALRADGGTSVLIEVEFTEAAV